MAVTIQVKRGTDAQIQAATLAIGELAFATDTKAVFTYDGVIKQLVGRAMYDTLPNRPAFGVAGRLFMDSATGVLYLDSGSAWISLGSGSHTSLSDIGTNTHAQIDGFISSATATPTASKIPIADGSGKLDDWVSLSSKASTDHDATHITSGSDEIDGDKLDIDWEPSNYTPTLVTNYADSLDNLTAHLKGIDTVLSSVGVADNSITLAKMEHGTQGDIYYCGASGAPSRLGYGTSGQYLKTQGASNNPVWADISAGGALTGSITAFAGNSVPSGYLECNGSNVSRSTYSALFTAIGTTWGTGDGSTTFTLPDLRRKALVGDGGTGTSTLGNAVGNSGGAETHTLSLGELASHNHGGATGSHDHGGATGSHNHGGSVGNTNFGGDGLNQADVSPYTVGWNASLYSGQWYGYRSHTHTIPSGTASISSVTSTISSAGSGSAHNNLPPSAVVKMIIKT